MAFSMYQASVPLFTKTLGNLSAILTKAETFAAAKKVDPAVLLEYRLAPDMFPFVRQVRLASDHARRGCARLAGVEAPAIADTEASLADLKQRIQTALDYLATFKPAQIEGAESRDVKIMSGGKEKVLNGQVYFLHHCLPNFFFHTTTAYAILRHCGVEIGKGDFIGQL